MCVSNHMYCGDFYKVILANVAENKHTVSRSIQSGCKCCTGRFFFLIIPRKTGRTRGLLEQVGSIVQTCDRITSIHPHHKMPCSPVSTEWKKWIEPSKRILRRCYAGLPRTLWESGDVLRVRPEFTPEQRVIFCLLSSTDEIKAELERQK